MDHEQSTNFINRTCLLKQFPCVICSDILVRPQITPCGKRACKPCIDNLFKGENYLKVCPMPHEDLDDNECQRGGLHKNDIREDDATANLLFEEKCFCKHQQYGCKGRISLKNLANHERLCKFAPKDCPNKEKGCLSSLQASQVLEHLGQCSFADVLCSFCQQPFQRKDIKEHYSVCDCVETKCSECDRIFEKRHQLLAHERTAFKCVTNPGRCYFYELCHFESDSIDDLKSHLKEKKDEHLEGLTLSIRKKELRKEEMHQKVAIAVNKRKKPLERIIADLYMQHRCQQNALNEQNRTIQVIVSKAEDCSNTMASVKNKVEFFERFIKEHQEAVSRQQSLIRGQTQSKKRIHDRLLDLDKHLLDLEHTSYDGRLTWKIDDYRRRKENSAADAKCFFYSAPFFTAREGYKLCLKAFINGSGLQRGKYFSLFVVVMMGEYDELLQFPFLHKVTLTLIAPRNHEQNHTEVVMLYPESLSSRKPETEMNMPAGCPQFAPQSLVESSVFLVNDSLHIKVVVERNH